MRKEEIEVLMERGMRRKKMSMVGELFVLWCLFVGVRVNCFIY